MHYYQFNIGDYTSHTKGLSLLEDLAYRRLIDEYYLSEGPFAVESHVLARKIGMKDHVEEVDYILSNFFKPTIDGWIHKRADKEIQKYKDFAEAGKKGASKRWGGHSLPIAPLWGGDSPPNPTPLANNNQEPITINQTLRLKQTLFPRLIHLTVFQMKSGKAFLNNANCQRPPSPRP